MISEARPQQRHHLNGMDGRLQGALKGCPLWIALALSLMFHLGPAAMPVAAQGTIPPLRWPALTLTRIPGNFVQPVHIAHAGDGSSRLFIVERAGVIRIIKDGAVLPTPFLDIKERVNTTSGCDECGLLSIAFPPDFASQGYFFVYYTALENLAGPAQSGEPDGSNDTVVARFRISSNPDVADPASEEQILVLNQPARNHNGGQLVFGPDGYLYIGLGDGGRGDDPWENGQDPDALLGKILRVQVGGSGGYTIPADNPFVGRPGHKPEIWAMGLRNPWRFSFDPLTGDLYIADVGQGDYEEVNVQPANSPGGENYGWDDMQGNHCYELDDCRPERYTLPVTEYGHDGVDCSVTGGVVFFSTNALQPSVYLYGDFCSGRIRGLQRSSSGWATELLEETGLNITSFGYGPAGEVYVASLDGRIYRIDEQKEPIPDLPLRLHFPSIQRPAG